jgi:hypothetical protein
MFRAVQDDRIMEFEHNLITYMITDFLENKSLKQHLWYALGLGLLLRMCSAYFAFGPQALDDYLNQLLPALRLLRDVPHDLPNYRSPLMIWMIEGWIKVGTWISIEAVVNQIRWVYFGLALFSLLGIYGAYKYFEGKTDQTFAGKLAVYLMAAQGLMPFVSTRSFLESFSTCFLTFGIGVLAYSLREQRAKLQALALYSIGFATLIRFQVGLVYGFVMIFLMWKKQWKTAWLGIIVGIVLIAQQLLIEFTDHRAPMSILLNYFRANENVATYGVTPWYSTWLTWLAFFYFPFSLGLFRYAKKWQEHFLLVGSTLVFVLAHSLVSHKEERFLYPILGLTMMMMAILWSACWNTRAEKFFFRPVFWILNTAILLIGCFVNTQVGEIGIPAQIQSRSDRVLYFDRDSMIGQGDMHELFLKSTSQLEKVTEPVTEDLLTRYDGQLSAMEGFVIATSEESYRTELQAFSGKVWNQFTCAQEQVMLSLTDGWLYKMNPKKNYRRRPSWFVSCWRS